MTKFLYILIISYPIIWLTGFQLLFFHILSIILFLFLLFSNTRNDDQIKINFNMVLFLGFLFIYLLSLINAYFFNDINIIRFFGSAYNFISLICGLFVVLIVTTKYKKNNLYFFLKYIWILPTLAGSISLFSILFFSKYENTEFLSFMGSLIDLSFTPKIIMDSSLIKLTARDWLFGSASIRTSVFGVYPNATAALMLLLVPLNIFLYKKTLLKKYLISSMLGALCILLTASRLSIFAFIFSYLISYIIYDKKIAQKFIIIIFFSIFFVFNISNFDFLLNARSGSTITRFSVIEEGLHLVSHSPWVGLGFKPKYNDINVSIGSHSTFIGALIKSGYLGFFFLLSWQIHLLYKFFKIRKNHENIDMIKAYFITLLSMSIWMIGEDIDTPQIVWFTYFVLLGNVYNLIYKKNFH